MQITRKLIFATAGIVLLAGGGSAAYAAATTDTAVSPGTITFTTTLAGPQPRVSAVRAIEIAQRTVRNAWVSELDLDRRGTRPDVWEVELTAGTQRHEIDIDAATGRVVKQETHRADRDDRGHDHDDD
ncbi:Peptidase propeptide and YPEB domain-containing protein [Nonomuraea maritima]|uniref:Peptidase propeptide and YPEB domain-containing protein n=1 Tax=Nonomuraea maritima TaxID=683260 RepID=A0A1G8T2E4_9ACTN|nr:PepSY domain-containing protein [Nonomuraea maritima]SDJ35654.1 Peptidase propeptide and YPEB domain-containing protein [Nonomuraea maritima]